MTDRAETAHGPSAGRPARRWWRWLKRGALALLTLAVLLVAFALLFPRTTRRAGAAAIEWLLPRYLAWNAGTGAFVAHLASRQEVKVPMRDGVRLATDLYFPSGSGPFPTLAVRSPYNKADGRLIADFFAR